MGREYEGSGSEADLFGEDVREGGERREEGGEVNGRCSCEPANWQKGADRDGRCPTAHSQRPVNLPTPASKLLNLALPSSVVFPPGKPTMCGYTTRIKDVVKGPSVTGEYCGGMVVGFACLGWMAC